MLKKIFIGVIGPNADKCSQEVYEFGLNLGKYLIDHGHIIVCGGKEGIMKAVCKGAHDSKNYSFGSTIGILPEDNNYASNKYVDIKIATGVGYARNFQIINTSDILIAVGGGAGTLSEIAYAWQKGKYVLCHADYSGWSKELGGKSIDNNFKDLLVPFSNINDIKRLIKLYL